MEDDSLVMRRPKRSTAGNRMEVALAEIAAEGATPDFEDDIDFVGPEDEDEVFDSDFQSTDEEGPQEDDAGEKQIQEEEKRSQRLARQRATKAAEVAKQTKTTFAPQTAEAPIAEGSSGRQLRARPAKTGRRVSLGAAVDAETGAVVESNASKRKSHRKSTVLNAQALTSRLKDAEERRAAMPKRVREVTRVLSQAELIARALDTEEGNITEHRDYLSNEEEKRRRARVVRKMLTGPVLRWISRAEEEPDKRDSTLPSVAGPLGGLPFSVNGFQNTPIAANGSLVLSPEAIREPNQTIQGVQERRQKVTRNYLIHEIEQQEGAQVPEWGDSMAALFGDHVNWDEMKVYSGKQRPISRPVNRCPLTGRPALYRDPRSGVPFANASAYRTLTRILAHDFVWNDDLGCYTAEEAMVIGPP